MYELQLDLSSKEKNIFKSYLEQQRTFGSGLSIKVISLCEIMLLKLCKNVWAALCSEAEAKCTEKRSRCLQAIFSLSLPPTCTQKQTANVNNCWSSVVNVWVSFCIRVVFAFIFYNENLKRSRVSLTECSKYVIMKHFLSLDNNSTITAVDSTLECTFIG